MTARVGAGTSVPLHRPFSSPTAHTCPFRGASLPRPPPPQLSESNAQREEVVGLLGGYQSSIRELQDQHSAMVVRLQGEAAALKAEVGGMWWQCMAR